MKIRAEVVGTFIDAVYAIAVTILALEIPSTIGEGPFQLAEFSGVLLEYAVAFGLLFAFWLQHRRINSLTENASRGGIWTSAAVLMLVCLVPRATTLVFEFGADVTLTALEGSLLHGAGWTTAEAVDLLYVCVVVLIDLGIMMLLRINSGSRSKEYLRLRRSKLTTTALLVFVVGTSFLLPVENRYFLLVIPIVLFFEDEISALVQRSGRAG